jgi:hypothetical protein
MCITSSIAVPTGKTKIKLESDTTILLAVGINGDVQMHILKYYFCLVYMNSEIHFIVISLQNVDVPLTPSLKITLTPWRRVLEKLIITHVIKNSLPFMEPKDSLTNSQEPSHLISVSLQVFQQKQCMHFYLSHALLIQKTDGIVVLYILIFKFL